MTSVGDQLQLIARKLKNTRESIATEEATKTTLIMPFIRDVLGFDVFDVNEVIPEFVADVGLKKGEKIDFAIVNEGEVAILIECKKVSEPLNLDNASQLFRYFHVTTARIAVLTNGNEYRFYTDLDEPNKMDSKPFLELNLDDIDSALVPEIEKLSKQNFDLDSVLGAAEELKYVSSAKRVFAGEAKEISWDMASLVISRIYPGRLTQRIRDQLTPLVGKGLNQFISDQVNNRLKAALSDNGEEPDSSSEPTVAEEQVDLVDGLETTEEELQAFRIIQAIVAQDVDPNRIHYRDAKSYCAILFDDNNRKAVCRLRFNNTDRLRVGLIKEDKSEDVRDLDRVTDLYSFADQIREAARRYL
ncbi:type I restriction enzyme HsdR N-terminal domain-containing protein [Nocardia zapadnayensis]|uniref:Type I restriction enzyme HsdR N-terminal domain-containing protein n=1 Tax=Brevibacterium pityocampae TaxID=506594 RepID=A0ABP8JQH3_9MICO|nr:type I restriction endonuclease [Nocardia zapadnayensis]MCX0277703.1 type I restriction enzyme HsdR N-terminal domain-containing protein [Nocardia zapadnayensis]